MPKTINIAMSSIPGVAPSVTFPDGMQVEHYDIYTSLEPKPKVVTDKQFSTVDAVNNFKNQNNQIQYYESFTLKMTINRSINVNMLLLANNITITDRDNTTYQVREIEGYTIQDVQNTEFKTVEITFNTKGEYLNNVVNHLTKKWIRDSESGVLADSALNRFTISVNPDWINATAKGDTYFESGFDYSSDNKDFRIVISATTYPITVDTNAASHADVATQINVAIADDAAAISALVEAYAGNNYIGFRSLTDDPTTDFELLGGTTDDLLAQLGVTAATYENNTPLDSTMDGENNTLTFYTKLMPYYPAIEEEKVTERLDGIDIPVYSNKYRYIELDFILDDYEQIYGTFTEAQAFDYYVGETWYINSSGNPKGETITLYDATSYDAIKEVEIEKIENEDLLNVKVRRVRMLINQLQNYRFRA